MKKLNKLPAISKGTLAIWWICRGLLFVWGVWGLMYGYTTMFVQATAAIIFTHLWDLTQILGGKSFITKMPSYLQTELNIFACFGCVVGSTLNNFTEFDLIDIPEHTYAGFLACSFGFVLCDIMQGERHKIKPSVQALFGMAVGVAMMVGWEFYEFTMDRLYGYDLQHALPNATDGALDTMVDLILGSAGAFIAMFVEAFRRVGLFGKDKEAKRAAYKAAREEAKRDKLMALGLLEDSADTSAEEVADTEIEEAASSEDLYIDEETLFITEEEIEEPVTETDTEIPEETATEEEDIAVEEEDVDYILRQIFSEDE